ncbi:unnamed protein product [Brassica rapa subsp. trilocularis]
MLNGYEKCRHYINQNFALSFYGISSWRSWLKKKTDKGNLIPVRQYKSRDLGDLDALVGTPLKQAMKYLSLSGFETIKH